MMTATRARSLHRPWALWLALLLAVFGALAPTVSHALVWARGDAALVEICTSNGPRWLAPDQSEADAASLTGTASLDASAPGAPASVPVLEHCPFCLLFADRAAPPPHVVVDHFPAPGHATVPASRQASLAFSDFAFAPPPRGPPAFLNY